MTDYSPQAALVQMQRPWDKNNLLLYRKGGGNGEEEKDKPLPKVLNYQNLEGGMMRKARDRQSHVNDCSLYGKKKGPREVK